jgi:hypothetical protein
MMLRVKFTRPSRSGTRCRRGEAGALIAWLVHRSQERDAIRGKNLDVPETTLHARQDLKLIVFLLAGAIVMLGIIADNLSH